MPMAAANFATIRNGSRTTCAGRRSNGSWRSRPSPATRPRAPHVTSTCKRPTVRRSTMRAAVLTEVNKPLELIELEQEGPKAGEVRVKVKAAGVCMSDWHIMNGDWPLPLPMVLGHEAAGIVVELGAGVGNVKTGDHVIFSFRPHCGHCRYCSTGHTVLCSGHNDSPRWRMHDGTARVTLNGEPVNQMARIGTFAEYVVCPAEQVVAVRQDLPWTHAAIIGCSVATGVGAVIRHANA